MESSILANGRGVPTMIVAKQDGVPRLFYTKLELLSEPTGDRLRLSVHVGTELTWMEFTPTCSRDILQQTLFAAGEIERALAAGKTGELKL